MVNKSLSYLIPLIDGWSEKSDHPINCYSDTVVSGAIVVCYNVQSKMSCHNKGIILDENDSTISITYFIMKEYMDDYNLIMKGKYSRISDEAKQLILERTNDALIYSHIESVLYKSKKRKKYLESIFGLDNFDYYNNEYESKFGEEEIFKLEKV